MSKYNHYRPTSYDQFKRDSVRGCGCLVVFAIMFIFWSLVGLFMLILWSAN